MEKDEYDEGLPDYGEAGDDVFASKEELPEPKAPPKARVPDGAAQDPPAAPNVFTDVEYPDLFADVTIR